MKPLSLLLFLFPCLASAGDPAPPQPPQQEQGETSELSEDDFVRLMKDPKTVILDARIKESFDAVHVKGALHLPLKDFNAAALEKLVPDKTIPILIYCDENFRLPPRLGSFQNHQKVAVTIGWQMRMRLKTYGYTKVQQLEPVIETEKAKIPLQGTAISKK